MLPAVLDRARYRACPPSCQLQTSKLIGGGVWPSYLGAPAFHGASGMNRDVDKGALPPVCLPASRARSSKDVGLIYLFGAGNAVVWVC
jgi:hypothetical protein